jgi:glycosyltransferase involved in cell wall biosynthesis
MTPDAAAEEDVRKPLPAGSAGPVRFALLLPDLAGGGVERTTLALAGGLLERGVAVDLLLCRVEGPLLAAVPPGVRLVPLDRVPGWQGRLEALRADPVGLAPLLLPVLLARRPPGAYRVLPALVRYLRDERPAALISAFPFENLLAIAARRLARGVPTRVVVTERNTTTRSTRGGATKWKRRFLPPLLRRQYLMADAVVAVSAGVADHLADRTGLPRDRIVTIHNPAVGRDLDAKAAQPLDHPWFRPGEPPVVLGVGRLVPQKDFPTLVRAFARVRRLRPARLVILGHGTDEARDALQALARGLGCGDDLDLAGFTHNPFAYMARASVFALSSLHEGLPGVLIQALACGCPAVSTDCPSGPAEILAGGRYGRLVPVGDDAALAEAIAATLDDPGTSRPERIARGHAFGVDQAVDSYLALVPGAAPPPAVDAATERPAA